MRTLFILLATLLSLSLAGLSQSPEPGRISEKVEAYISQKGFSGTILLASKGKPIFHQSYGLAYRATPDTLRNSYRYSIASVTKLFTSIRILQLVEQGKVQLHEPLLSYLPQFEQQISEKVSIHHLLLHISGLPEERDKMYRHPYEPAEMVAASLQQKSSNSFEKFNYNNIDYLLLGLVIETVTQNSWENEIKQGIIDPLGLKETGFLEYGYYPRNFAYPYSKKGKQLKQDPLFYIENFYAAGCMYATSLDLLALDQALYGTELLTEKSKKLLETSYPAYQYVGYGVWNYTYPFVKSQPRIMERRGGIRGANVCLVRILDDNFTLIILSNDDRFNPDSFGDSTHLREMLIQSFY
jgi:D-alanyl-D-alanine carboxypeptidase